MATAKPPPSASIPNIPDLDLGSSGRVRQGNQPRVASGPGFGTDMGLDEELWESDLVGTVELADEPHATATKRNEGPQPWPNGVTPPPGSLELEPHRIDKLCTWGPEPNALWRTAPYAMAVILERRALTVQTRRAAELLFRAEERRDVRLAALGQQLLDQPSTEPCLQPSVDAARTTIASLADVAKQRDALVASEKAKFEALEQALKSEQQQLQGINSRLVHCQIEVEQAELNLKRERARLQRLHIERRNLEQRNVGNREQANELAALEEQASTLAPRLAAAERALSNSRAALQHLSGSAESTQSHVQELQRLKEAHPDPNSPNPKERSAEEGEGTKLAALADLGRAALAAGPRIALDSAAIAELQAHDDEVTRLAMEHQVFVRALDNFHRPSVRRGVVLILIATALFVFGVLRQALS